MFIPDMVHTSPGILAKLPCLECTHLRSLIHPFGFLYYIIFTGKTNWTPVLHQPDSVFPRASTLLCDLHTALPLPSAQCRCLSCALQYSTLECTRRCPAHPSQAPISVRAHCCAAAQPRGPCTEAGWHWQTAPPHIGGGFRLFYATSHPLARTRELRMPE